MWLKFWCKFGAKTYRTIRKICHDMRRKRHKIKQNERFSTIFRGINAPEKTRRDKLLFLIQKALLRQGFLLFITDLTLRLFPSTLGIVIRLLPQTSILTSSRSIKQRWLKVSKKTSFKRWNGAKSNFRAVLFIYSHYYDIMISVRSS